MGFIDGAARIWPSWTFHSFGHTIPLEIFVPGIILPGIIFNIGYAWPALERKFTGDNAMHNLLDRPSLRPHRTALGSAIFAFLIMLFIASSTDVLAMYFRLSLNTVLWAMRVLVFVVPLITYPVTKAICKELGKAHRGGKRKTANVVTRTTEGEYVATPAPAYIDDLEAHDQAIPVPTFIVEAPVDTDGDDSGVRVVER
jgi:ubiquinol-cytochrome c reductase cytochrome b subunit